MNEIKETPVSLVMKDGVIPSEDGVTYKFRHGTNKEVWLWEIEGYDNEAFYVFSYYPTTGVMDDIKDMYAGEEWFDPYEMDEIISSGYDINPVWIAYENGYKLPYQNISLRDGRIYAHDEETGKDRELIRMRIYVKDDGGNDVEVSFYMFSRYQVINKAIIMNLLSSADSKLPRFLYRKMAMVLSFIRKGNDFWVVPEDVYVLSEV